MARTESEIISSASEQLRPWGVRLGAPLERPGESWYITVPDLPHVFYTQRLQLRENGTVHATIPDAMVMMAHGYSTGGRMDQWRFVSTQQPVSETVRAYEDVANRLSLPHLDAILVCRYLSESGSEGAQVLAEARTIPYIWPVSPVRIVREEYPSAILTPNQGVELVIANNRSWHGVARWQEYWNGAPRRQYRNNRAAYIPNWAKNAA